jgi:hypothetical protein
MQKFNYTNDHKLKLRLKGEYFGYPNCCINNFLLGFELSNEQTELLKNYNTRGFIPCISCCIKILIKETNIESLIIDRKHNIPLKIDFIIKRYETNK